MIATFPDRDASAATVAERAHIVLEDDANGWNLTASDAREGARLRGAFRTYLERHGDPASDFDAAEAVYGELVNTCVRHAPGELRIEFRWDDVTLVVVDSLERLRSWPFSPDDTSAEATHHAYALISAFTGRLHLTRDASGGTRASVALPVRRAQD